MFGFFKKKDNAMVIAAPIEGEAIPVTEVSDPVFGEEMLGKGIAIKPTVGKVFAPADGKIEQVFDTKHAISMTATNGAELLIHVGLDTVKLNGAPFTTHVNDGDTVQKGDLMLEFDIDAIKAAGLQVVSPVVVTNPQDYKEIKTNTGNVKPGEDIVIELIK